MQARFLLGPAGSGKTHRCLEEIREALRQAPEGPPLILLAPKQATFQLERQLLALGRLAGYTRLQILSFPRLAEFLLQELAPAAPEQLSEEGRLMVLRALLVQKQSELKLFRSVARLPGLAEQLSSLWRELQQQQITDATLRLQGIHAPSPLAEKLHDVATILQAYRAWLVEHHLVDPDGLLDLATAQLPASRAADRLRLAGLWLDGFAEMTPQEVSMLGAVAPLCQRVTLAFCLPNLAQIQTEREQSWHGLWSTVERTASRCYAVLQPQADGEICLEKLAREKTKSRFSKSAVLQELEQTWAEASPLASPARGADELYQALSLVQCAHSEAEVVYAAREIRKLVRAGGRYREAAVLLRHLDLHHDLIRRVFGRYEIPFFLDRRESVTHHPLAELTRCAVRLIAFGWQHDDWFGALKSGLAGAEDGEIDALENEALARGWQGEFWLKGLPGLETQSAPLEKLRQRLLGPFSQLAEHLGGPENQQLTGTQLSQALIHFWKELRVEEQLENWTQAHAASAVSHTVHASVWNQLIDWLDNVRRAFPNVPMPLREWLPVMEAGLGGLSIGAIPPALDQVLVGSIDRSRNPDLKLALILGMNEGIFPAPPPPPVLLTENDRAVLNQRGLLLGLTSKQRLGHERYYGYIACTRARERLVLTYAARDSQGRTLNPSSFLDSLKQIFPALQTESFQTPVSWREAEHACELVAPLIVHSNLKEPAPALSQLAELPIFSPVLAKARGLQLSQPVLGKSWPEKLYGQKLKTSVSGLEQFAACPARFFISHGLKAGERQEFEVAHREKGSFQHEILNEFHRRLQASGKAWRDLTPADARHLIGVIGEELITGYGQGLFAADAARRFTARGLIEHLQQLMEVLIGWMPQYRFDPEAVEVSFGLLEKDEGAAKLPAWELSLGDGHALVLRGRIDRVDICRVNTGETLAVVIDYKSSAKRFDAALLHHGLELQLPAYLAVLRHVESTPIFKAKELRPAGMFYVNLKGQFAPSQLRPEVFESSADSLRPAYQHQGRFNADYLKQFDDRGEPKGDQFNFTLTKGDLIHKGCRDPLPAEKFEELLDVVEEHLRTFSRRIFAGEIQVAPFRKGSLTACDHCEFKPVCRFDPWSQPYRVLRTPPKQTA